MASEDRRRRVGARIRSAREAKGFSQWQLADLIPGAAEGNSVSRWERGKTMPSWPTLEALAKALDVPVAWLLSEDDD
jgi:transcriptional regulator with XRE-family HTH domain